ncbi:MAG: hypothetical protein H7210_01065 [Pyrinomonadaceae bacterium]|nr:hypothetical protein [Phycisphaerales bacterium]
MSSHLFRPILSRLGRLFCGAAAAACLMAAPALASDVSPGETLEPIPLASLPSGSVLEGTYSRDFDISWTVSQPFPIVRHVTGAITQNVYRTPSNTLVFRYYVSNDSDSDGAITRVSMTNFSDFSTDVTLTSNICFNCENADRAYRDIFGTGVALEYDLGIATGYNSRPCYVRTNASSFRVSNGRFVVVGAGRVTVTSGTHSQSLYGFAYPVVDSTPPIASITSPTQVANSCNPVVITGRAYDTAGFDQYTVEYATNANGPWTEITSSTTPHNTDSTLATWNTTSVTEGYYLLRLTAVNTSELSTSVTTVVYVDKAMSPVLLRAPNTGNILGGLVCFDGTIWDTGGSTYTIRYRALPSGVFAHVVPASTTYPGQIITDGLGSWNTSSGPTAVPDGSYQVRVVGTDGCGYTSTVTRDITVDNTAPIAFITSPIVCSSVRGVVAITGTIADTHLNQWTLQYTGGDVHTWTTIASGNNPVTNGVIANWDTSRLRSCAYTFRLIASDSSGISCSGYTNSTEFTQTVFVGCAADFNHDDFVNSQDFFDFLSVFFAPCP